VVLNKFYSVDQIKVKEVDRACGKYWEETYVIRRGNLKEGDHLENLNTDSRKILK
jgi:hypothetical protein